MSSGAASWMLRHCGGLLGTCLAWVACGLGAEWTACCVLSCCRALVTVAREASSSLILACMAAESLGNDLTKPPKPSCGPGLHGCYGLGP